MKRAALLGMGIVMVLAMAVVSLFARQHPASQAPQTTPTQAQSPAAISYHPEIPVNEYWDYAQIGDLHIYVNNTDRNVIYALDPSGKIAWTFWAKDYGLDGYEIRNDGRHFFLTGLTQDVLGNWFETLLVVGIDGKLHWMHQFDGGIDMPKMLLTSKTKLLILDNNNQDQCDRGCGVLCSNKPSSDDLCNNGALWAFDVDTGRVVWKNATRNFYFYMQTELPNGDIQSNSMGIGPGRWQHEYVVSSTTGIVTAHSAIVNDVEFGQDQEQLHWDEVAKTISLTEYYSTTTRWTVHAPHPLYDLIARQGQQTGLQIYSLSDILIANLGQDTHWTTYGIDKTNGRILWHRDFDSAHWTAHDWRTGDGVLLFTQDFRSACEEICRTCPKNSWICVDTPPPPACNVCKERERNTPGYSAARIMAVNAQTGKTLWSYNSGESRWLQFSGWRNAGVVTSTIDVNSYENGTSTRRTFDVHTGAVLNTQFGDQ